MSLKIGDKVRIRTDLMPGKLYGNMFFAAGMVNYKDKTLTILKIEYYYQYTSFILNECPNWTFTKDMFQNQFIFGR